MATGIRVYGIEEAVRKFDRLGAGVAFDKIQPVLVRGAKIIRDEAENRAPRLTGALKGSLVAKAGLRKDRVSAYVAVDMSKIPRRDKKTGKRVRYPYFVEYGTKLRVSRSRRNRTIRFSRVKSQSAGYFRGAVRIKKPQVKAQIENDLKLLVAEVQ